MSITTFCTRIFDPYYIYLQAERQVEAQPALKALIEAIGHEHLITEDDFGKKYPLRTFYHRYSRYTAVLALSGNEYQCTLFVDGSCKDSFDILQEENEVKKFFESAKEDLTVIDYFSGKEIKPDFEMVRAYTMETVTINKEYQEHSHMIDKHKKALNNLKQEGEVLYSTNPSACYKSAINLFQEFIATTEILFGHKHRANIKRLNKYVCTNNNRDSHIKMFGLYVYVVNYALKHKRFLTKGTKGLSANFNQTLDNMRKFIAQNEGIVDMYIDFMQLTQNEQENLIYMLTEEALITNSATYVGDELFA